MRILFDQGVPGGLAASLRSHEVTEARQLKWERISNGELLKLAEGAGFNLLLTTDKRIWYQQNLAARKISIVVLGQFRKPVVRRKRKDIPAIVDENRLEDASVFGSSSARAVASGIRALTACALVVEKNQKGGSRLKVKAEDEDISFGVHVGSEKSQLTGAGVSMSTLANQLGNRLGTVVIVQTGLHESYDLNLEWAPDGATDSSAPSLVTALREQLGLRLEPTKSPVEVGD